MKSIEDLTAAAREVKRLREEEARRFEEARAGREELFASLMARLKPLEEADLAPFSIRLTPYGGGVNVMLCGEGLSNEGLASYGVQAGADGAAYLTGGGDPASVDAAYERCIGLIADAIEAERKRLARPEENNIPF